MTMEKYSQDEDTLLLGLRDEEAQLMQRVQAAMASHEKTADEEQRLRADESRLAQVRAKITSIDMERAAAAKKT